MSDSPKQSCPICSAEVPSTPRYPRRICKECLGSGVEIGGKIVQVATLDVYRSPSIACLVKGHKCEAREAHLGGIVVQAI